MITARIGARWVGWLVVHPVDAAAFAWRRLGGTLAGVGLLAVLLPIWLTAIAAGRLSAVGLLAAVPRGTLRALAIAATLLGAVLRATVLRATVLRASVLRATMLRALPVRRGPTGVGLLTVLPTLLRSVARLRVGVLAVAVGVTVLGDTSVHLRRYVGQRRAGDHGLVGATGTGGNRSRPAVARSGSAA
jgi:hypothetical protein